MSSLVHSSTLVTAGLFILIILGPVERWSLSILLSVSCVATILSASIAGAISTDLKNLVALSTLRQLSLIFVFIRFGNRAVGLCHLLLHALFKRRLFIGVGVLLHRAHGGQDFRLISSPQPMPLIKSAVYVSVLGLAGLPFYASFHTKEGFLLGSYRHRATLVWAITFIGAIGTIIYRMRIYTSLETNVSRRKMILPQINSVIFPLFGACLSVWLAPGLSGFLISHTPLPSNL